MARLAQTAGTLEVRRRRIDDGKRMVAVFTAYLLLQIIYCPGPAGRLSALSVIHSKFAFYGVLCGRAGRLTPFSAISGPGSQRRDPGGGPEHGGRGDEGHPRLLDGQQGCAVSRGARHPVP
jgi:hypothetical protein